MHAAKNGLLKASARIRVCGTAALLLGLMIQQTCWSATAASGHGRLADLCSKDPRFRGEDFALGDWTVYGRHGKQIAAVNMRRVLNGCAILETWNVSGKRKVGNVRGLFAFSSILGGWLYAFSTDYAENNYFIGRIVKPGEALYHTTVKEPDGRIRLRRWSLSLETNGEIVEQSVGSNDGGKSWSKEYELTWKRNR